MENEKSLSLLARRKTAVANGVGLFNTGTATAAHGAIIIDADGNELLDFAGGIGVVNAGHCPAPVVAAIKAQAEKFIHTSFNVVTYEPYIALCEAIAEVVPHGDHTKVMLVSTGAEAVENAIKIARQATKRAAVLCFTDAFHGRTMMAMSLTSKVNYKQDCGPFAPEVYRIPFPNYYRYHGVLSEEAFIAQQLEALEEYGHTVVEPTQVAAIILEPVQGEGGFYQVPQKYLEGLRSFCDKYGILLILDEIQSGFCRTGKWASWQHYQVQPDISLYAKSLGSGMPIAAVVGSASVMDAAVPGTIGGTYIGNPVCCAAALATIQFMKDEDLNTRAMEIGKQVMERFVQWQHIYPAIGEVRGLGAMTAIEFVKDGDPQKPDADITDRIMKRCAANGLIIISAGTFKNIIRILSPLVITSTQLKNGLDILEEAIKTESNK